MRKSIVRGSVLAVAALSMLLGGGSATKSVKEQVSETPVIVGKAIENRKISTKQLVKGTPVQPAEESAQAVVEAQPAEEKTELAALEETEVQYAGAAEEEDESSIEVKEAVVECNQVVANIDSYLNIREEASEDAEVVGKFYTGNVGTIVEKGDEWSLVASGNAYGYVNNDYLLFGSDAKEYIENNCDQVAKVAAETVNIRAEQSTDSEVVTLSDEGDSLTVLGEDNGWVKVAVTDDAVGYVSSDYVCVDYIYETAVTIEEEEAAAEAEAERLAEEQAETQAIQETYEEPAQTQETAYEEPAQTQEPVYEEPVYEAPAEEKKVEEPKQESSSSEDNTVVSGTGADIADYAVQFVGNPYVYGGTSLTNGADCSGFVQSVYKHFGYSLSRTSQSQAGDGVAVSTDSLQPGDLLFYHGFGHVAIYIGGGQVVHASTAATGIKISNYDYSPIDKAVRIVD